ncbi:UNVERIFIED_ORG: sulfotransferase domain-containing protein [Martelella mediterranea]
MALHQLRKFSYRALGFGGTGRQFKTRPDDRFIVGYPKSGNTWVDFIVATITARDVHDVNFTTINSIVADIHSESPIRMSRLPSPRWLKSHDYYHPSYNKVLLVVRHPYAVAVSFYYYYMKNNRFDESYKISEFVESWIKGEWGTSFSTWGAHTESWLDRAQDGRLMVLRYEDLKKAPEAAVRNISSFFELEISDQRVDETVAWCSAENMAKLENDGLEKGFRGFKSARKDIQFVRSSSSTTRQTLTDVDKKAIFEAWADVMKRVGYEA